jgi:hypothetical protein
VLLQVPKEIQEDLIIKVWPVRILDRNVKELRNKKVLLMKVLWKSSQIEEKTWEWESKMMTKHPRLFPC